MEAIILGCIECCDHRVMDGVATARPYSGGLPARRSMRASGVRDFLLMRAGLLCDAQSVTWVFATIITALVAKSLARTL
jgi:hypothetical protein